MQAAVETILARLDAGLARKLKFNVRGNDDEHWIKLNYKGYECCIHLEAIGDDDDTRISMVYCDNIDLRIRVDADYTVDDIDVALPIYLARMKMFVE
jgi:hypothetical protein